MKQMSMCRIYCAASIASIILVLSATLTQHQIECKSGKNQTDLLNVIKGFDTCVVQSTFSYLLPSAYPPKTTAELRAQCKSQQEAFKCVKEKSRGTPGILRRGMVSFISTQQKNHRKYCTNLDSEPTKKFIQDTKCIMEKRFNVYKQLDESFAWSLIELSKKNYNDPRLELQHFCCIVIGLRKSYIDNVGPECASSAATVEEMAARAIPEETSLICDDEDKLAKVCPKLPKLNIPKPGTERPKSAPSPSALGLYLVATLGESRDTSSLADK